MNHWNIVQFHTFVTSEDGFKRWVIGDKTLIPIGFPLKDVFGYVEGFSGETDWSILKRWQPKRTTE
jgi:hypothetical protein